MSCISYKEVQFIAMIGAEVKSFSAKGLNVELGVKLRNPNNYKITVVDSDLDIFINGKPMGKAKIKNKIKMKKNSEDVHHFIISADYDNAAVGGLSAIMAMLGASSMQLRIKGKVKAKALVFRKTFDVDFTERVSF
ncbi:MAG: hypothetical protein COA57_10860 [Flavobacteriales bacterium]|nr:MAG: hypothetical protein COA57_10860 [Flavobacteriales bacterium]